MVCRKCLAPLPIPWEVSGILSIFQSSTCLMRQPSIRSLVSVPRPLLVLSLMLLSGGTVATPGRAASDILLSAPVAQATPVDAADLAQMQREADRAFERATTLFFVLLGTLVLLLGVGVVMLWLLRRSVVQEGAEGGRHQVHAIT